jgi:dihydrofolate reductase
MKLSMISAMTRQRVIGTGQGIPWHLPRDSRHFRAYTAGKPMLLGRRTYEEMIGWFTTQHPIILTRQTDFQPEGASVVNDVPSAITLAESRGASELVVSGGAQIYAAALPYAEELVLTVVDAAIEGRAQFPDFQAQGVWRCQRRETHPADAENVYAMEFQWWTRDTA